MFASSTWRRLLPLEDWDVALFHEIDEELEHGAAGRDLANALGEERYPLETIERLGRLGMWRFFADAPGEPSLSTIWHVNSLNALLARRSASLAISIGINGLALLPLYIAGTAEQIRFWSEKVLAGKRAAMGLSEWDKGSDLADNETRAVRDGDGYVLTGEKRPINQARMAHILTVLARTSEADSSKVLGATAGMSVFMAERDGTVVDLERVLTLPVAAADIAGFRLDRTRVPMSARIGEEGAGFALVQKSLTISRGGISAFASGTSELARSLAGVHLRERVLYGNPIAKLDAVAEHHRRAAALELAIHCLSIKATALANAFGQRASYYAALAKYVCCELCEACADEGRRILSARALIRGPYETVVRDAILYASFDGTRHVVLDGLRHRARQAIVGRRRAGAVVDELATACRTPPASIFEAARKDGRPIMASPLAHARALAEIGGAVDASPMVAAAEVTEAAVGGVAASDHWRRQSIAFEAVDAVSRLEAALAVAELGDDGRRRGLGLVPAGEPRDPDAPAAEGVATLAIAMLAGDAAARGARLAAIAGLDDVVGRAGDAVALCARQGDGARRAFTEVDND